MCCPISKALLPFKVIELDPNFPLTHWLLGHAYLAKGMYEEAIAEFKTNQMLAGGNPPDLGMRAYAYALAGQRDEAQKIVSELTEMSKRRYVPPYWFAIVYTGLGERDRAFEWFEKAYQDRSVWMPQLKVNPLVDSLRSDPRFADLIQRMRLPINLCLPQEKSK